MSVSTSKTVYGLSKALNLARWKHRPDRFHRTPRGLFEQLDAEFHFTLDAAAAATNAMCARFFTVADDALRKSWAGEVVWCTPPYGRGLGTWVWKAREEAKVGATVVMLVPSSTDLGWWHDYATDASEIRFIRGRVRFGKSDGSSTHSSITPSAVLVFRPRSAR